MEVQDALRVGWLTVGRAVKLLHMWSISRILLLG